MFFDNWILDGYVWSNIALFGASLLYLIIGQLTRKKS